MVPLNLKVEEEQGFQSEFVLDSAPQEVLSCNEKLEGEEIEYMKSELFSMENLSVQESLDFELKEVSPKSQGDVVSSPALTEEVQ